MRHPKTQVSALALSAAALVALISQEGWSDKAIIPVKGDVPTVGPGLTRRADGSPVQLGDTIKPVEGIQRSLAHVQKDERGIKACVTAPLSQVEYDLMVDFSYQYGVPRLCKSSMVSKANAGDYIGACEAYKLYRKVAGYDCSTLVNGVPNDRCWGVWKRSKERAEACLAVQ